MPRWCLWGSFLCGAGLLCRDGVPILALTLKGLNMTTKFVPVDFDNIDEGRFLERARRIYREMQTTVRRHAEEFHGCNCKKGVAELTLTYQVGWEVGKGETEPGYYQVAKMKLKEPGVPDVASGLIEAESDDGTPLLFTRASGTGASRRDNPRQLKLCTDDGVEIDQETGEVHA